MYRCVYQATGQLVCQCIQEHFVLNQVPGSALDNNGYLYMYPGDVMKSSSGQFTMTFEQDGNLVIRRADGLQVWHANVAAKYPSYAVMQGDGNFVLYRSTNPERSDLEAYWMTNTYWATESRGPFRLQLQDTGKLVLYDRNDMEIWSNPVGFASVIGSASMFTISHPDGRSWKMKDTKVRLQEGTNVKFTASSGGVYKSSQNRIALFAHGDSGLAVRHSGLYMYYNSFEANNYDWAWFFIMNGDGSFEIYNEYGGGHYVGYDSNVDHVLIVRPDDPRRVRNWRVSI